MVVMLGRDKNDPISHGGYPDIPQQFLGDDSLHLYSLGVKPGLVWCAMKLAGCMPKVGTSCSCRNLRKPRTTLLRPINPSWRNISIRLIRPWTVTAMLAGLLSAPQCALDVEDSEVDDG